MWHHKFHVGSGFGLLGLGLLDRLPPTDRSDQSISGTSVVPVSSNDQHDLASGDDLVLIAECVKGNSAAFGVLVRRYQDRLYHTAFRLVGNAEDAQDAVQEAFLNAYQSLESFKGDSLFFTWLYRIAVNTAISLKRKHRALLHLEGDRATPLDPVDDSPVSRPGHGMEQAEEGMRVQEALNRLSPEHRAVLVLKDMEGQKYEAMAELLNVPIGTIRSRLHRARLELRELLEKTEEG
jgi:RNA polymerase sigma-70 factor (ECF subfamily)